MATQAHIEANPGSARRSTNPRPPRPSGLTRSLHRPPACHTTISAQRHPSPLPPNEPNFRAPFAFFAPFAVPHTPLCPERTQFPLSPIPQI